MRLPVRRWVEAREESTKDKEMVEFDCVLNGGRLCWRRRGEARASIMKHRSTR